MRNGRPIQSLVTPHCETVCPRGIPGINGTDVSWMNITIDQL